MGVQNAAPGGGRREVSVLRSWSGEGGRGHVEKDTRKGACSS